MTDTKNKINQSLLKFIDEFFEGNLYFIEGKGFDMPDEDVVFKPGYSLLSYEFLNESFAKAGIEKFFYSSNEEIIVKKEFFSNEMFYKDMNLTFHYAKSRKLTPEDLLTKYFYTEKIKLVLDSATGKIKSPKKAKSKINISSVKERYFSSLPHIAYVSLETIPYNKIGYYNNYNYLTSYSDGYNKKLILDFSTSSGLVKVILKQYSIYIIDIIFDEELVWHTKQQKAY